VPTLQTLWSDADYGCPKEPLRHFLQMEMPEVFNRKLREVLAAL